ncbi:hypothetical protein LUZ60_014199 [Juncus effusus]|nr:hypothetical protein LUZ60_014199 [Juncus effusus]
MDAGFSSYSSEMNKIDTRPVLREPAPRPYIPPLHSSRNGTRTYGDRFIPNRSTTDMDVARCLLAQPNRQKESNGIASPSKEAYRKALADTLLGGRTRIFSFRNKPKSPVKSSFDPVSAAPAVPARKRRHIPQSAERTLDAPDITDDFYLNLLDWGSTNVLSIALGSTVYLWNGNNGSTTELVTVDDDLGPVTSVSWAPDGRHLAIGLDSSNVQLWDVNTNKLMRTLRGIHSSRVGSLAWKSHILSTGSLDASIVNNDIRLPNHNISRFRSHTAEVCGLKWSNCGQHLASGGNDSLVNIWNLGQTNPSKTFRDHTAAVKALAWCPYQNNVLATGGGGADRSIKFWNVNTGACLNSVETGSQVCGLLWNKNERELLSSHGLTDNQLTLWKYPSMSKMTELHGHTSRVLYMAQSPDGCTVASAAGDETLRFWNVFGSPEEKKQAAVKSVAKSVGPTNRYSHIR